MLGLVHRFPSFHRTSVVSNDAADAFQSVAHDSEPGKWKVMFFWPKDFTFVCPTEIAGFGRLTSVFDDRDAQRPSALPHMAPAKRRLRAGVLYESGVC